MHEHLSGYEIILTDFFWIPTLPEDLHSPQGVLRLVGMVHQVDERRQARILEPAKRPRRNLGHACVWQTHSLALCKSHCQARTDGRCHTQNMPMAEFCDATVPGCRLEQVHALRILRPEVGSPTSVVFQTAHPRRCRRGRGRTRVPAPPPRHATAAGRGPRRRAPPPPTAAAASNPALPESLEIDIGFHTSSK